MKSIKEWMIEKGIVEDFDKNALTRYFGSSQITVDPVLRRELKPKVERILDMEDYRSLSKEELMDRFKAVVSHIVAEMSGTSFNSRSLARKLDGEMLGSDVNKFAQMMGSGKIDVDYKLRREMKPKIERIMDMDGYKDIPKSELEQSLLAVIFQLISDLAGNSMSISKLKSAVDSEEPVAIESLKLPSFYRWIENNEGDAVSEPQHKQGEENMDLKGVVEKRLMQMAMEIESEGKGSRQDILAAMKEVIASAEEDAEGQPDQNQDQGQSEPQMPAEAQPGAPNPQQAPQQNNGMPM